MDLFLQLFRKYKKVYIWIGVTIGLILVVFTFLSNSDVNRFSLILNVALMCVIITSMCAAAGYSTRYFFKGTIGYKEYLVSLLLVILAAVSGKFLSYYLAKSILKIETYDSPLDYLGLVILVTVVVNTITNVIESLNEKRRHLEFDLESLKKKGESRDVDGYLLIKNRDDSFSLPFRDIAYLSSHGKNSVIHTSDGEYQVSKILKDLENEIESPFLVRVHKQFVINISFIHNLKYYEGGRYMAYLSDEEESVVPVGRMYVSSLKEKLSDK